MLHIDIVVAQRGILINNSDSVKISNEHFDYCILKADYKQLLDKRSRSERVYFEYMPYVNSDKGCDGIYFYRYVSRSIPQLLFREKDGRTYSKYYLFIIWDGKIISLIDKSRKERSKALYGIKIRLEEKFGLSKIQEIENDIINGYIIFY